MKFRHLLLLLCCVSIFDLTGVKADAPGVHLVRQGGTKELNQINEQFHRRLKWSHGAYFFMDQVGGRPPTFYSLNRDGAWIGTAQFHYSEPVHFSSFAYDRESDGTIVFSGQTDSAPRIVAPFLAWISADGQSQRMARTGNYFAYGVAVAPDDTIWTLGLEMVNLNDRDPAVDQEAHILRHYDRQGNLIDSALPQSQLSRSQRSGLLHNLLVATRERVGWYSSQVGSSSYTEVSLDTMMMKAYPGATDHSSHAEPAEGLAVTSMGTAVVSVEDRSPDVRTNYVFKRDSSTWVPVSVPHLGGFQFSPILIGMDGEKLVFNYGSEAGFFSMSQ